MQTDPIGYGDGMNWYNYVGGDPVNGIDPSGLSGQTSGDPNQKLDCSAEANACRDVVIIGQVPGVDKNNVNTCQASGCFKSLNEFCFANYFACNGSNSYQNLPTVPTNQGTQVAGDAAYVSTKEKSRSCIQQNKKWHDDKVAAIGLNYMALGYRVGLTLKKWRVIF